MSWKLDKDSALVRADHFTGAFDLSRPWAGMSIRSDRTAEVDPLFALPVPESMVDTYIRGNDLVCKYPPRDSDLVSYQTYFRLTPERDGIELILSAQTSLLDSAPQMQVTSSFGPSEMFFQPASEEACEEVTGDIDFQLAEPPRFFLVRPKASESNSWVIFVHPSDFYRASLRCSPDPSVSFTVFPESLEKGVIRRASFQIRRLDRRGDVELAARALVEAEIAVPPLAT